MTDPDYDLKIDARELDLQLGEALADNKKLAAENQELKQALQNCRRICELALWTEEPKDTARLLQAKARRNETGPA
jgi:regulator of replication initiation timing